MDYIRLKTREFGAFQHGAAEENKPLVVIREITRRSAVQAGSVKIMRVMNEINAYFSPFHKGKCAFFNFTHAHGNIKSARQRFKRKVTAAYIAVARQKYRHFLAAIARQHLRKRAGHIGQPACFAKRKHFTGSNKNVHFDSLPVVTPAARRLSSSAARSGDTGLM